MMNSEMLAAFESAKTEVQELLENCEKTRGKKFRVYVELMQTLTLLFKSGGVGTGILTAKTAEVCGELSVELGLSDEDSREALNIVRVFEKIGKELEKKLLPARAAEDDDDKRFRNSLARDAEKDEKYFTSLN